MLPATKVDPMTGQRIPVMEPVKDCRHFLVVCQRHASDECVYRVPAGPCDEGCVHVDLDFTLEGIPFSLCKRPI